MVRELGLGLSTVTGGIVISIVVWFVVLKGASDERCHGISMPRISSQLMFYRSNLVEYPFPTSELGFILLSSNA